MKLKLLLLSAMILVLPLLAAAQEGNNVAAARNFIGQKYQLLDGVWELQDLDLQYMQLHVNTIRHIDPQKYELGQSILDDYQEAVAENNAEMLRFLAQHLSPLDFFLVDTEHHQMIDLGDPTYDALSSTMHIEDIRDFDGDDFLSFNITNQGFAVAHLTVTILDETAIAITFHQNAMTDRDLVVRCLYRRIR